MFTAINTESAGNLKKMQLERKKIITAFIAACRTLKINEFSELKVVYKPNEPFFKKAKTNLYIQFIQKTSIIIIEALGMIEQFLESKELLFEMAAKYISEKKYIRAKKILNIAFKKEWYCNKLYDLLKKLKKLKYEIEIEDDNEFMKRKININKIINKF